MKLTGEPATWKQRVCFVVIVKLMRMGKKWREWVGMMGIVQEAIK